jgi:hypothetical protein
MVSTIDVDGHFARRAARSCAAGSAPLLHAVGQIVMRVRRMVNAVLAGNRPALPLQGRTNKTAVLGPAPTNPSWPVPTADRVNVRESLFAEAFNRLLQQNLAIAAMVMTSWSPTVGILKLPVG